MSTLELLIGTLIERPDLLPSPRPPLAKRMCPRCDLVLGWQICPPAAAGTIIRLHCSECRAIVREESESLSPRP